MGVRLIKGDNDYLYLLGHLENFNDAHGKQHKVGDLVSLVEVPVKVGGGRSWEDNSKAAGGRWHSTIMEESLRDREEAVVLAKAYLQNLSMQYQTAECKCEGDQRIFPGMRVTVKYVGESYSGEYIANHVIHEFSVYGGYTTTVYLKRNMAGGEKKRVSEIERERGQLQQMKLEPMAFSGEPASGELQYKELSRRENPIVGEEVGAEYVGENDDKVRDTIVVFSAIDLWNTLNNIGYNLLVRDNYKQIRMAAKDMGYKFRLVNGNTATNQMFEQLLSDKSIVRLVVVAHGDFDGNLYDVNDNVLGFNSHMPPIVDLVGCYASKKKSSVQGGHKNEGHDDIVVNTYNPGSSTDTIDDDTEIWWNQTNEVIMKKIPESIRKGNAHSGGDPCVSPESFTKWITDKL